MSPARFRWGVLFIIVGVLLLLNNIGELDWWVWADLLSLWPLILIVIGLEKIFTKSKLEFVAYLPILGLAAAVFWVALSGLNDDESFAMRRGGSYRYTVEMENDVERIEAKCDFGDIDVSLTGTSNRLFRARSNAWRRVPKVEFNQDGPVGKLDVSTKRTRLPNWVRIDNWGRSDDWDLFISDQVPISLECRGDQSDMTLDCRSLLLEDLFVNSERGDIRIDLGELKEFVKVKLEGDEADFRVSVPSGSGVKISGAGEELRRLFEREGLVETGGLYVTEGYDTLKPQIEFDLSPDLSQFSLDDK